MGENKFGNILLIIILVILLVNFISVGFSTDYEYYISNGLLDVEEVTWYIALGDKVLCKTEDGIKFKQGTPIKIGKEDSEELENLI